LRCPRPDHLVAVPREPASMLVSPGGIWLRHRQPGSRGQRHYARPKAAPGAHRSARTTGTRLWS